LNPAAWRKHREPVFQATARTWGPGHNCFVRSADGTEDWLVFHAKLETKPNWKRAIHVQRFRWHADGRPDFGEPIDAGIAIVAPSGDVADVIAADTRVDAPFGRAALAAAMGDVPMVAAVKIVETAE